MQQQSNKATNLHVYTEPPFPFPFRSLLKSSQGGQQKLGFFWIQIQKFSGGRHGGGVGSRAVDGCVIQVEKD